MTRVFAAVATAGALALAAAAVPVGDILPASGPLPAATVARLVLVDAARAGSRVIAVGDRGYIVFSDDGGASWSRARAPEAPMLTAVQFVDAKNGWAVGHDSVILATRDGGESWTQQFSAAAENRPLLDVLMLSPEAGIAVGAYGAYYETSDGGAHWAARRIAEGDRHYNGIVRLAGQRLVIVGEEGTILASEDAGRTWSPLASPYKGSLFGAVVAADGAIVAFGLRGHIYRSGDGGRSWQAVDNASSATLMGGTRLADGTLVLAGAAGTALVSRDDGRSFVPLATGSTRIFSTAVGDGGERVLLVGEDGARALPLPGRAR